MTRHIETTGPVTIGVIMTECPWIYGSEKSREVDTWIGKIGGQNGLVVKATTVLNSRQAVTIVNGDDVIVLGITDLVKHDQYWRDWMRISGITEPDVIVRHHLTKNVKRTTTEWFAVEVMLSSLGFTRHELPKWTSPISLNTTTTGLVVQEIAE